MCPTLPITHGRAALCVCVEEEEEEFIRIHGYCRGAQGARCYPDGASLQPDESEGCSPVSVVGLIWPSTYILHNRTMGLAPCSCTASLTVTKVQLIRYRLLSVSTQAHTQHTHTQQGHKFARSKTGYTFQRRGMNTRPLAPLATPPWMLLPQRRSLRAQRP